MENHGEVAGQAYAKMAQLCSRSEQCSADVRKKIVAYDLVSDVVDEIIEKLKAEKFLDDRRYIKAYVSDKFRFNKWGKIKLRYYLKAKGLPETMIEAELDEIDEGKYREVLVKTMKDKAKTIKKKDKFDKMGPVIRFAQNRGFEPELIHRYMNLALE